MRKSTRDSTLYEVNLITPSSTVTTVYCNRHERLTRTFAAELAAKIHGQLDSSPKPYQIAVIGRKVAGHQFNIYISEPYSTDRLPHSEPVSS